MSSRPETPPAPPGPSCALALAALSRAVAHRPGCRGAVPMGELLAHLDLAPRSAPAAVLRARLAALERAGVLARGRRGGATVWSLTSRGRGPAADAAARARLPESPQHRAWRRARTTARLEIGRLRGRLQGSLREAEELLAAPVPAPSERWFELAERLRAEAWTVGSASHCLYEWREPGEDRADVDDGPPGRRNTLLWVR